MSDIQDLVGPKPVRSPAFPTPWSADGFYVIDADNSAVFGLNEYTHPGVTRAGWNTIATFIAEAVNEKVARDSFRPITITDGDGDTWTSTGDGRYSGPEDLRPRTRDEIVAEFGISE
jgi:hypothetical protein